MAEDCGTSIEKRDFIDAALKWTQIKNTVNSIQTLNLTYKCIY